MSDTLNTSRKTEIDIDPMFIDRWSPRSFLEDAVQEEDIKRLFEQTLYKMNWTTTAIKNDLSNQ